MPDRFRSHGGTGSSFDARIVGSLTVKDPGAIGFAKTVKQKEFQRSYVVYMEKIELFRQFKREYVTSKTPVLIDIGPAAYLAFRGQGEPGGEQFQQAIGALYGVAWTIKMTRKFGGDQDFKVCPLEGLYWEKCDWQMLIRVPDFVAKAEIKKAAAVLVERGKGEAARQVELVNLKEGRCAQVLQLGPYSTAPLTIHTLQAFAAEKGYEIAANCHEIYLNDPRRVPPERLKTIIRISLRKMK